MQDILSLLGAMRRPKLLVQAARFGVSDYRRNIHLRRLLGYGALPQSGDALFQLLDMESEINVGRKTGNACYSPARHIEVLIAIMGEARILRASQTHSPIR